MVIDDDDRSSLGAAPRRQHEAVVDLITLAAETIVDVKVQSGPSTQNFRIGGDIKIGWRTRHGLALK